MKISNTLLLLLLLLLSFSISLSIACGPQYVKRDINEGLSQEKDENKESPIAENPENQKQAIDVVEQPSRSRHQVRSIRILNGHGDANYIILYDYNTEGYLQNMKFYLNNQVHKQREFSYNAAMQIIDIKDVYTKEDVEAGHLNSLNTFKWMGAQLKHLEGSVASQSQSQSFVLKIKQNSAIDFNYEANQLQSYLLKQDRFYKQSSDRYNSKRTFLTDTTLTQDYSYTSSQTVAAIKTIKQQDTKIHSTQDGNTIQSESLLKTSTEQQEFKYSEDGQLIEIRSTLQAQSDNRDPAENYLKNTITTFKYGLNAQNLESVTVTIDKNGELEIQNISFGYDEQMRINYIRDTQNSIIEIEYADALMKSPALILPSSNFLGKTFFDLDGHAFKDDYQYKGIGL